MQLVYSCYTNLYLARVAALYNIHKVLFLIICSDGALKASYQQLKVASNEKQSVDTVNTGVQADYLAGAPG